MRSITLGQRLRYAFDNTMSRGTPALIGWLALVSLLLIVAIAFFVWVGQLLWLGRDEAPQPLGRLLWMSLMRTLDPGTMGGDEGALPFLFAMLAVTLGGIFIVSALIGVITAGVEGKIEELRKGRSFVVEQGHTLILGWSDQIFTILSELAIANASERRPCVVILANKDKVEMEDAIRDKAGSTGKMRIVCRTGSPIDPVDLEIANPHAARSIVVLAPEEEDPDSQVIKTVLAITNNSRRRPEPYHIVVEIHDPKNMEAARLVGGDETQLIEVGDVIARLIAQTCRQSGLSVVYTELLDFHGDEIYFREEPALFGKTFGEALFAFERCAVMGLQYGDGRVELCPPLEKAISPGDQVIAIAEDDSTLRMSTGARPEIDESAIHEARIEERGPERTLILGWNRRGSPIINELDHYVAPGSSVTVVAGYPEAEGEIARRCSVVCNQKIDFRHGDTTDRRTLDSLRVEDYEHVIVLSYADHLDPQRADARTLITLLHLRDIETRLGGERFSIVTEMLDDRNRQLAEVTEADDFIVSDKLISLILAQVSENKRLNAVFTDLFDPEGAEIYLKPVSSYVHTGREVSFYTVVEAARRRGEVALGYRLRALGNKAEQNYGVVVNPDKAERVTFSSADRLIVLAAE